MLEKGLYHHSADGSISLRIETVHQKAVSFSFISPDYQDSLSLNAKKPDWISPVGL